MIETRSVFSLEENGLIPLDETRRVGCDPLTFGLTVVFERKSSVSLEDVGGVCDCSIDNASNGFASSGRFILFLTSSGAPRWSVASFVTVSAPINLTESTSAGRITVESHVTPRLLSTPPQSFPMSKIR